MKSNWVHVLHIVSNMNVVAAKGASPGGWELALSSPRGRLRPVSCWGSFSGLSRGHQGLVESSPGVGRLIQSLMSRGSPARLRRAVWVCLPCQRQQAPCVSTLGWLESGSQDFLSGPSSEPDSTPSGSTFALCEPREGLGFQEVTLLKAVSDGPGPFDRVIISVSSVCHGQIVVKKRGVRALLRYSR